MSDSDFSYTVADLQTYVDPSQSAVEWDNDRDVAYVSECWDQAVALGENLIGTTAVVPDDVRGRAYLEIGSELWQRRKAPSGLTQFLDPNGGSARLARDPLTGARAIVAPYLVGIA